MSENQYFPDLSVYTHQITPFVLNGVFNIGWINPRLPVQSGEISNDFFNKLIEIANAEGRFNGVVEPIRELPYCDVCGEVELKTTKGGLFFNSELWIPGDGKIFASPISIIHLIRDHKYCPPKEYIEAVLAWHSDLEFNGDAVYREKLRLSDWFKMKAVSLR